MIDKQIKAAIRKALDLSLPFAAFAKPHSDKVHFYADIDGRSTSGLTFKVNTWCGGSADEYIINCRAGVDEVLAYNDGLPKSTLKPWPHSTSKDEYLSKVDELIERLCDYGGKTVFSRTICGRGVGIDWTDIADKYFKIHPEAFRYIYFTPRHGAWLGASPEVLICVDKDRFSTMALAGTRTATSREMPWDGKNLAEQAVVRNFIVDRLYNLGLEPETGKTETVVTGNLEHLRTVITGNTAGCSFGEILRALNPTPALAGYPIAAALENIVGLESHPRRCYGAYVAVDSSEKSEAYVNIRCVNFDLQNWCMYVGGGIMPDSDSEDEWRETEAKAALLLDLILNAGGEAGL